MKKEVELVQASRIESFQKKDVKRALIKFGIPFEIKEMGDNLQLFLPESANHFAIYDLI